MSTKLIKHVLQYLAFNLIRHLLLDLSFGRGGEGKGGEGRGREGRGGRGREGRGREGRGGEGRGGEGTTRTLLF